MTLDYEVLIFDEYKGGRGEIIIELFFLIDGF